MYFKDWPFRVVPERSSEIWADRKALLEDLNSLVTDLTEKGRSTICCVWGYVGAGKSHALFHLKAITEKNSKNLFIFSPMPKEIRKYADLYVHGFFQPLNFFAVSKIAADVWSKLNQGLDPMNEIATLEKFTYEIADGWIDFGQVIMNLGRVVALTKSIRDPFCLVAQAWLSGARLSKRELRFLGVTNYIKEETDFVRATSSLIKLLTYRKNGCTGYNNVFWALDDSHYLAVLRRNTRAFHQIQQGLRDSFDACPNNLCLILSFASREASKLDELLVEDLSSRVSKRLHVPPLSKDEAFEFITELINYKDFKKGNEDTFFPYTEDSIKKAIDLCIENTDCTPRNLMKWFDKLTTAAEKEIFPQEIRVDFVSKVFKNATEVL